MREIKFRAWDKELEFMVDPDTYLVGFRGDAWFNNTDDGKDWLIDQSGKLELMQYTGLKDKNGVEIFEGDILKLHDHPTGVNDCTTTVVFNYGAFEDEYHGIRLGDWGTAWSEVIGNIHQNPELLEATG